MFHRRTEVDEEGSLLAHALPSNAGGLPRGMYQVEEIELGSEDTEDDEDEEEDD
jgi:hypothetical protein